MKCGWDVIMPWLHCSWSLMAPYQDIPNAMGLSEGVCLSLCACVLYQLFGVTIRYSILHFDIDSL